MILYVDESSNDPASSEYQEEFSEIILLLNVAYILRFFHYN